LRPQGGDPARPIIGRLIARGLDDELRGSAYAVIDGTDGRTHHARLQDLEATSDGTPGSIVELRRFRDSRGRERTAIAVRSDLPLAAQVESTGATWLDRQLIAREPGALSSGGFGLEVQHAMNARAEHLIREGLARREGQHFVFSRDLLNTLRRREIEKAAALVTADSGLPYHPAAAGDVVHGIHRQRLNLASGRFAMIDDGLGFSLTTRCTPAPTRLAGGRNEHTLSMAALARSAASRSPGTNGTFYCATITPATSVGRSLRTTRSSYSRTHI
jgi:Protein of unknown function (DUF3363)